MWGHKVTSVILDLSDMLDHKELLDIQDLRVS